MFTPVSESSDAIQRNVKIANLIALIFAGLTLVLLAATVSIFGASSSTPYTFISSLVFLSVILLNRYGFTTIGRILLCAFLPAISLYITLLMKRSASHTDILYYDSRIILLASGFVPCLVFSTHERIKLYGTLIFSLLCLIMFDPLHEALGQGYYQKGFTGRSYYYINQIVVITFLAIAASAMILKIISERAENYNINLIRDKEKINESLKKTNSELKLANTIIQNQRNELTEHNRQLEKLVQEKSKNLIDTNEELVKHNHELRQFSYTISHNLRAPIARLLGLTNLLNHQQDQLPEELKKLVRLVRESSLEFDDVVRDLNKIIDVRNEFYRIKEKVSLEQEFQVVTKTIGNELFNEVDLTVNFSNEPVIYTVRPIINSIFYNLISNALKYRSETRKLALSVRTLREDNFIVLEVTDNGMGMNLDSYGRDVFGLYKRFHTHVEGRGLGLYLVKSQIESQGGKITVTSQLNAGTTFRIYFKILTGIEGQVCFSNSCCTVFYNAKINALALIWKQQPTSEQFRQIFNKSLEMVMLYNTPIWISEMKLQGEIAKPDAEWLINEIIPAAAQYGMKQIISILEPEQANDAYRQRLREGVPKKNVTIHFFQSSDEAEEWIESNVKQGQSTKDI